MQGRKQGESPSDELLNELTWYLRRFGETSIFMSESVNDLNKELPSSLHLSQELYPLLIELAEKEAIGFQQKICEAYLVEDEDDPFTPETWKEQVEAINNLRKLSPREFWLTMMNRKREP